MGKRKSRTGPDKQRRTDAIAVTSRHIAVRAATMLRRAGARRDAWPGPPSSTGGRPSSHIRRPQPRSRGPRTASRIPFDGPDPSTDRPVHPPSATRDARHTRTVADRPAARHRPPRYARSQRNPMAGTALGDEENGPDDEDDDSVTSESTDSSDELQFLGEQSADPHAPDALPAENVVAMDFETLISRCPLAMSESSDSPDLLEQQDQQELSDDAEQFGQAHQVVDDIEQLHRSRMQDRGDAVANLMAQRSILFLPREPYTLTTCLGALEEPFRELRRVAPALDIVFRVVSSGRLREFALTAAFVRTRCLASSVCPVSLAVILLRLSTFPQRASRHACALLPIAHATAPPILRCRCPARCACDQCSVAPRRDYRPAATNCLKRSTA